MNNKISKFTYPFDPLTLEMLDSIILSFGWSVKKWFPFESEVGPSVNENPSASFSSLAPDTITSSFLTL